MRNFHAFFISLVLCGASTAGDWAQWLGPNRNGTTDEKLSAWKEAPKIAWRAEVGEGHSSPIIAQGKVFLHTKVAKKDAERVAAYDLETGKQVWEQSYARGPFSSIFGLGPRSTPCVHAKRIYTLGVTGILVCWNAADGKQIWKVDTQKTFSPPKLRFGVSCSPIVIDNQLLINVGAKGASIVAFDAETGKVKWKSGDDPASYSSPLLIGSGEQRQVLFLTQKGVVSLNPTNGKQNWKVPLVDLLNESSTTPVEIGDRLLASSVTFGSLGIALESKEKELTAKTLWRSKKLTCYFSTPIAIDDKHVFMVTGSIFPPPKANLHCVDVTTGKVLWTEKQVGRYHAAMLRTGDGKLLMLDDKGFIRLLEPSTKKFEELAKSKVCGATWAHPALSDGNVLLRDDKHLICLRMKK